MFTSVAEFQQWYWDWGYPIAVFMMIALIGIITLIDNAAIKRRSSR